MEELDHINYIGFVDVFRDRADAAAFDLSQVVAKLESYSVLCEKFFAIPLETAKSLLQKCLAIQEGLRLELPDFESLVPISDSLRWENGNIFNNMGRAAHFQLMLGGFTAKNIFNTYAAWRTIMRVARANSWSCAFNSQDSDRNYDHVEFMNSIFSLPTADIFCPEISARENHGLGVNIQYGRPIYSLSLDFDGLDNDLEDDSDRPQSLFIHGARLSETSTYASSELSEEEGYSDRDEHEDRVYVTVQLGEYRKFEKMCIEEEELQQAE